MPCPLPIIEIRHRCPQSGMRGARADWVRSPCIILIRQATLLQRGCHFQHLRYASMNASYDDYVEHPRFGRRPRRTGLRVDFDSVRLPLRSGPLTRGPHSPDEWEGQRSYSIAETAVEAKPEQQAHATFHTTHYLDLDKRCSDCHRRFIFFAVEQQYWYETLKLPLYADCVRCVPCRKKKRGSWRQLARYRELTQRPNRNDDELLELIDLYLALVSSGEFSRKRLDRVRRFANLLTASTRSSERHESQLQTLRQFESESGGP